MPIGNQAAQFTPFAALTGFGGGPEGRQNGSRKSGSSWMNMKKKLDDKIRLILEEKEIHPEITVTFFVPDEKRMAVHM